MLFFTSTWYYYDTPGNGQDNYVNFQVEQLKTYSIYAVGFSTNSTKI